MRKETKIVITITIVGGFLRLYRLNAKSLWFDEIHSLHLVTHAKTILNIPALLTKYYLSDPPLFHLLQYLFLLKGNNEFWVRVCPSLIGTFTIPILYLFLRDTIKDNTAALMGSFSLAISPYHIYYSQEGRPYALFLFFSLLSFYSFFSNIQRDNKNKRVWYIYSLFTFLSLMTHYLSFFMIICQIGILLIYLLRDKKTSYKLKQFLYSLMIIGITYIAWLPSVIVQRRMAAYLNITSPPLSLRLITNIIIQIGGCKKYAFPLIVLVLSGIILETIRGKNRHYLVIFFWWLIFPIIAEYLYITHYLRSFFDSRYVIYALPSLLSLLSLSFTSIKGLISHYLPGTHLIKAYYVVFLVSLLVPVSLSLSDYYYKEKRPWREVVTYLKKNGHDQDVIITTPNYFLPSILYYFGVEDYLVYNQTVHPDSSRLFYTGHLSSLVNLERLLPLHGVWCITNHDYMDECSKNGFRVIKEFNGLLSSVLIYGNEIVFKRSLSS